MKNKLFTITKTIIMLFVTICIFSGCFIKQINTHKDLANIILQQYKDYDITIIETDPNSITINIRK